jgi:adenine-specific DNA-methyltransferase
MDYKQKLELTWIGKGDEPKLEPRILLWDKEKSYGDENTENMLIHGDNLLALKALEQEYTGKIKCIYIDPPYNTGEAFAEYDDNLEHSIWLQLMSQRLKCLNKLLAPNGTIFVQLNDEEMSYCKVIMDEIFGRSNAINLVSIKTKNTAGASGGGEDKRLKKNVEYILIYAKNYNEFTSFNDVYEEEDLFQLIEDMRDSGKSWKYTSVLCDLGEEIEQRIVLDGSGDEILVKKYKGIIRTTIRKIMQSGSSEQEAYKANFDNIFSDTNAQSSIRARIIEEFKELKEDEALVASYVPKSGRDKGKRVYHYYISPTIRRVIWLKDSAEKVGNRIVKKEKAGTYWQGFNWNNVNKEGNVVFGGGKKPEQLIQRVLELATNEGDLVLDSFLGSGTTVAVAHKMNRRWIGIELGDHCYTHCKPRLEKVVDGEQGGISKAVGWQGGGGFKFYELAPSLLKQDTYGNWVIDKGHYNPEMLAAAVAKLNGYRYEPHETVFWKQGKSHENSYIFVTTQYITAKYLDLLSADMQYGENLLICCPAYDTGLNNRYDNIIIKKIPQAVLDKCEFGVNDYNINLKGVNSVEGEDEEDE